MKEEVAGLLFFDVLSVIINNRIIFLFLVHKRLECYNT